MKTSPIYDCTEISQYDLLCSCPVLSVLVITYNHEQFLAQTIEGIIAQITNFPMEIVIGEDCSKDGTRQIALNYQKQYPKLVRVLFPYTNIGAKNNLNMVLSRCRGQYIATCEGDDYWIDTGKLQKQIDFLRANDRYVVCYHNAAIIDENGNITKASKLSDIHKRDFSSEELISGAFLLTLSMCFRNVIRTLPEEYFEVLNGDTFLISLLGNHGDGHYMEEVEPAMYRQHSGGVWSSIDSRKKIEKRMGTFYWLVQFYQRTSSAKKTDQLFIQLMNEIDKGIAINNYTLLKYSVKKIKNQILNNIRQKVFR